MILFRVLCTKFALLTPILLSTVWVGGEDVYASVDCGGLGIAVPDEPKDESEVVVVSGERGGEPQFGGRRCTR